MKENFDTEMERSIAEWGEEKRLLLHACCAPCAAGCVDRLTPHFSLTFFFYNPNIASREEYDKRAEELRRFASSYLPGAEVIVCPYVPQEFLTVSRGLEEEPERGARCEKCYRLRLSAAAEYAANNGFDAFATTLTLSPLKNADLLNKIGRELAEEKKVRYLVSDFKKRGGNIRSKELCEEFSLYRQNFCGCSFSKNNLKQPNF